MAEDSLGEYRFAAEDSDHIATRLQGLNVVYLTFATFLLGAIGILPAFIFKGSKADLGQLLSSLGFTFVGFIGLFASLGWRQQSKRYRVLLAERFRILQSIETREDFPYGIKLYSEASRKKSNPLTGLGPRSFFGESLPIVFSVLFALDFLAFAVVTFLMELQLIGIEVHMPGF